MKDLSKATWEDIQELHENGVFCPEAWVSLSSTTTGRWRPCCYATAYRKDTIRKSSPVEHMNCDERKQMRQDMLVGIAPEGSPCERCHHAEALGKESRRTRMMDGWNTRPHVQEKILDVIRSTGPNGEIIPTFFERVDVKFTGNKCNLRCFTCIPHSSSAFAVEARALGKLHHYGLPEDFAPVQDPFAELDDEMTAKFWADFEMILPRTAILNFTGGEPFMIDAYWKMIELAVSTGAAPKMELHLSSNMTMIKDGKRSVMDYFGEFRRVRLQASIDATPEHNNYIRYPSDFDTIIQNIHLVQNAFENVDIIASAVVSSLNVKCIPALYDLLQQEGIKFVYENILHTPQHQRIDWLPERIKQQYLENEYNRPDAEELFGDLMARLRVPGDEAKFKMVVDRCRTLDKHRGTDFTKLWPEFVQEV